MASGNELGHKQEFEDVLHASTVLHDMIDQLQQQTLQSLVTESQGQNQFAVVAVMRTGSSTQQLRKSPISKQLRRLQRQVLRRLKTGGELSAK
jgi:hypothetical protein